MTKHFTIRLTVILFLSLTLLIRCQQKSKTDYEGWQMVGGNPSGNKYSTLSEIDTSNVKNLKIAWEYHAGDVDTAAHSQIQCNPIIVDGVLYGTSPKLKLFAIDAATGVEKWAYIPFDSIA